MGRARKVLIAIWLLVIVAAIADMIHETRRADAAANWPRVEGRIVESRVSVSPGRRAAGYEPDIAYEYRVGGRLLRGRTIWIGSRLDFQSREDAEAFLRPYAAGAPVRIFYNPADPADAALITENLGPMMIFLIVAAILGIVLTFYWPRLVAAADRRTARIEAARREGRG